MARNIKGLLVEAGTDGCVAIRPVEIRGLEGVAELLGSTFPEIARTEKCDVYASETAFFRRGAAVWSVGGRRLAGKLLFLGKLGDDGEPTDCKVDTGSLLSLFSYLGRT